MSTSLVHPLKSLAVLPLVNQSRQAEHEYLCDGLTEEMINALTQIEGLRVTSRTSSFFFKNKPIPLLEIGAQLRVSTLLEGSIQVQGNKLRVAVGLIDVQEDYTFWTETFYRSMEDIFQMQREISQQIAERLREHMGHLELTSSLPSVTSPPVDAYTQYLRSRYHMLKMNEGEIRLGISILEELQRKVPDYPYVHLGIHMGYTLLGTLGYMRTGEAFLKGMPHLHKAIELDDSLPECQLQMAWMSFLEEWDLDATYKHLQAVRNKQPIVDFYQTMTSVLITERKYKAAKYHIDIALQMDPFSEVNHHLRGFICYIEEQYEQAIDYFRKSQQLKVDTELAVIEWGQSLILLDRPEEAIQHFQSMAARTDHIMAAGGLALAYQALGEKAKAHRQRVQVVKALATDQTGRALQLLILIESYMGDHEQALAYIAQAIEIKLPLLVYLKIDPFLKPLHTHPRFAILMDQVLGTPSTFQLRERKYKQTLLNAELIPALKQKLLDQMEDQQPYLDPHLTLSQLAEQIAIPANQLSQLLNEAFEQNFSAFVNAYRLEAFKEKLVDPRKQHLTLLALAYESGFNSKTVFNTYFKKTTGYTPKAYQKEILKL